MTGHDKKSVQQKVADKKEKVAEKIQLGDNHQKATNQGLETGAKPPPSLEDLFMQHGLGTLGDDAMCVDPVLPEYVPPNSVVEPDARKEQACLQPDDEQSQVPMLCERPLASPADGLLGGLNFYPKHRFLALGNADGQPSTVTADDVLSGGHVGSFPFGDVTSNVSGTDTHAKDLKYFQAFQDGDEAVNCQTIPAGPSDYEALQDSCVVPTPYALLPTDFLGRTNSNSYATKGAQEMGGDAFVDNLPGWAPGVDQSSAIDFGGVCSP